MISVSEDRKTVEFIIPAWSVREHVHIPMSELPDFVAARIDEPDARFHAMVNTGAERAEDLQFSKWEPK